MTVLQNISEDPCGCDHPTRLKHLISVDDALERVFAVKSVSNDPEELQLSSAVGRILANPVIASARTPPFDNSAMDGYAVNSDVFLGNSPWVLNVVGRAAAGHDTSVSIAGDDAARIFTGAPLPQGADTIIMQEEVQRVGDAIVVSTPPKRGAHVRRAGEDMQAGDVILERGSLIGSREVAACAAAGCGTVHVARKLRVAILVTGDEVRSAGTERSKAGIWDINTPMLQAALSMPNVDLVEFTHAQDDRAALQTQIAALIDETDLLITTGGVSVGDEDHVKPVMNSLRAKVIFSGVAMKPGKPVTLGRVGQTYWLGLPGNPLSAFVTWEVFGKTLVEQLSGVSTAKPKRRNVTLGETIHRKSGRTEFRTARLAGFDEQGREVVSFDGATHSGRVATLPRADGLIVLPAEFERLPKGALVEFQPFCES